MSNLSLRGQNYARNVYVSPRGPQNLFHPDKNPDGIVTFADAENARFPSAAASYNQGFTGTLELCNAMANHINTYFAPTLHITAEHLTWAAGVTALIELLTLVLCDEEESILIGSTIYGMFNKDVTTRTASKLEYVKFGSVDQFSPEVVLVYETTLLAAKSAGKKIKALLICNPHNPLGRAFSRETLRGLLDLASRYNIHLISDEIYALSMFPTAGRDAELFTSVLSLETKRPDLVHVLYGMSKDFAGAGLRLGCLISRSPDVHAAVRPITRFGAPSEFSMALATQVLSDASFVKSFFESSSKRLGAAYARTTALLDEAKIPYNRAGNAGFFIWLDLSRYVAGNGSDEWLAESILSKEFEEAGVDMAAGSAYHAEKAGYFRLIFTAEDGRVGEGIKR
ncbi:putative classes I and II family [Venturia nashicola]|nr:putative classes I and II family [Venturia nashicola]